MSRDIEERLRLYSSPLKNYNEKRPGIEVRRIALNMDQIEQYQPPPNPAKVTDSRAEGYMRQYGDESWELDALEPDVIVELIEQHIESEIDYPSLFDKRRQYQEDVRDRLRELVIDEDGQGGVE